MKTPVYATAFKRDIKLLAKRGKDLSKIKEVGQILLDGKPLDRKYVDHPLKGNYNGFRDLHIEPDWILIYKTTSEAVFFERTGTHSDLF